MQSNPLILALETATLAGSVCLMRGNNLLVSCIGDSQTSHSNSLLRDINNLLEQAAVSLADVHLLAVAVGPGSFTGLRIGLATVKALSATLDIPSVGVPTLEAVAASAGESPATVALLPAGRGEVFVQLFSVQATGEVQPLDSPAHLKPPRVFERYGSLTKLIWAGEGAHIHCELIDEQSRLAQASWTIAPVDSNLAKHVADIGLRQFAENKTSSPELLTAIYVRPSDAELNANVVNN